MKKGIIEHGINEVIIGIVIGVLIIFFVIWLYNNVWGVV